MKTNIIATTFAASLALQACSTMSMTAADDGKPLATASLRDASGRDVGTAQITQAGQTLYLSANVTGQAVGEHGIHFHAVGKCEVPGFTSAGGHLNPAAHQHGSMNPAGPHLGDLPNINVAADGTGSLKIPLTGSSSELMAGMFDSDGTAIVFHAGPDDYKTDPSGNSGGRLACGVLAKI